MVVDFQGVYISYIYKQHLYCISSFVASMFANFRVRWSFARGFYKSLPRRSDSVCDLKTTSIKETAATADFASNGCHVLRNCLFVWKFGSVVFTQLLSQLHHHWKTTLSRSAHSSRGHRAPRRFRTKTRMMRFSDDQKKKVANCPLRRLSVFFLI